ncbi:MAG: hypothetical protein BEN18_06230 [Epulopiscium sp. Nuni2H_MBin001]|nr:MAG: hypothetical protein BEN18_06230 [Epulopiscium sp. Nuni2H_MBin001]
MIVAKRKDNKFTTEVVIAEDSQVRVVYAGQPEASGGTGTDFRPGQLVLAGYAACANMTVNKALIADNIEFEDIIVSVEADTSQHDKTKIGIKIEIMADISQEQKDKYIQKGKTCFVGRMLSSEKEFVEIS